MTRNEIAAIVAEGSPFEVELVKGEGYWYFTASADKFYETRSVYVMRKSDLTDAAWIAEGRDFIDHCKLELENWGY